LPFIGRIFISAIFLISGLGKITAPAGMIGYIKSAGLPLPLVAFAIAVVVEIGGGLALIAGYRTRFVATVLAVMRGNGAGLPQRSRRSGSVHPFLQEHGDGRRAAADRGLRRRPLSALDGRRRRWSGARTLRRRPVRASPPPDPSRHFARAASAQASRRADRARVGLARKAGDEI
jgi:hypothetical protein